MAFIDLHDLEIREMAPGFHGRFVHTEKMTIVYWDILAGSSLPAHSHRHEQVTTVVDGIFDLTMVGDTQQLAAGKIAVIPPDIPHEGRAVTACRIMDVFSPPREDYMKQK
ncbi:MAG: cupin domain-containing protein [Syntrophales bacterium]|jgi:quercetin dioxygenase-like cupin family protein